MEENIHKKITLARFVRIFSIVVGLVLIWRGIWYILDEVDILFLGGHHLWSTVGGIIIGLLLLYIPDGDFKEIEKL